METQSECKDIAKEKEECLIKVEIYFKCVMMKNELIREEIVQS